MDFKYSTCPIIVDIDKHYLKIMCKNSGLQIDKFSCSDAEKCVCYLGINPIHSVPTFQFISKLFQGFIRFLRCI